MESFIILLGFVSSAGFAFLFYQFIWMNAGSKSRKVILVALPIMSIFPILFGHMYAHYEQQLWEKGGKIYVVALLTDSYVNDINAFKYKYRVNDLYSGHCSVEEYDHLSRSDLYIVEVLPQDRRKSWLLGRIEGLGADSFDSLSRKRYTWAELEKEFGDNLEIFYYE